MLGKLGQAGDEAKILAGGQSLLPLDCGSLGRGTSSTSTAFPASTISRRKAASSHRRDGARARARGLAGRGAKYPLLLDTAEVIADPLVRNKATVGGNLAHADPATIIRRRCWRYGARSSRAGPKGTRTIAIDDLFIGLFETSLEAGRDPHRDPDPEAAARQRRRLHQDRAQGRRLRGRARSRSSSTRRQARSSTSGIGLTNVSPIPIEAPRPPRPRWPARSPTRRRARGRRQGAAAAECDPSAISAARSTTSATGPRPHQASRAPRRRSAPREAEP